MEAVSETEFLRSIFPEEIWLLIGNKIRNIHDHLRLRDSSAYFGILFKNELDRAMFSEVAKILQMQLQRYPGEVRNVMRKCRLVCRHWQACIDEASENFPIVFHPLRNAAISGTGRQYVNQQCFLNSERITSFRQHFAQTHAGTKRIPFSCHSVNINYGWQHVDNLIELFREYGLHVRNAFLFLPSNDLNILGHYKKLQEILELIPNLQILILYCDRVCMQDTALNNLELHLETHPLPTLEHLSFLQIYNIPTSVANALMRANPQVTMLRAFSRINSAWFQEHLPNLELFAATLENLQQFRVLQSSPFVWSLKELCLQICHGIPTKDLFELLGNRWSATLTELQLVFWDRRELLDVPALQLPKLQMFSLEGVCCAPLDFLLPTKPSLKFLSLKVDTSIRQNSQESLQSAIEAEQTVKFFGFCNNLLQSNILSIFPNLRSVDYLDKALGSRARPQVHRRFDWMLKQTENV